MPACMNVAVVMCISFEKMGYGLLLGAKYKIGFEVHTNTWI